MVPFWVMGWFCHHSAMIKFLIVLLTFSDTSPLGRLGHLVEVFESRNLGSSLSFVGLGRGRAQCFLVRGWSKVVVT